jgi:hypothetical protein
MAQPEARLQLVLLQMPLVRVQLVLPQQPLVRLVVVQRLLLGLLRLRQVATTQRVRSVLLLQLVGLQTH